MDIKLLSHYTFDEPTTTEELLVGQTAPTVWYKCRVSWWRRTVSERGRRYVVVERDYSYWAETNIGGRAAWCSISREEFEDPATSLPQVLTRLGVDGVDPSTVRVRKEVIDLT